MHCFLLFSACAHYALAGDVQGEMAALRAEFAALRESVKAALPDHTSPHARALAVSEDNVSPALEDKTQSISFPQENGDENVLVSSTSGLHFNVGSSYKAVITAQGVKVAGNVAANSVASNGLHLPEGHVEGMSRNLQLRSEASGIVLDAANGPLTFKHAGEELVVVNPVGVILNTQGSVRRATVSRAVSFPVGQTTTAVVRIFEESGIIPNPSWPDDPCTVAGGVLSARVEMHCYGGEQILFESFAAGIERTMHNDITNMARYGTVELHYPSCHEIGVKVTNEHRYARTCHGHMTVTITVSYPLIDG